MGQSVHAIASLMRRLDSPEVPGTEEPISTRLLQVCLQQRPSLGRGLIDGVDGQRVGLIDTWRRGGQGEGDLVGMHQGGPAVHVEIKSHRAQINFTSGACRRPDCPGARSQLAHMLEDGCPVVVISPPGSTSERQMRNEDETTKTAVVHRTWSDVAELIEAEPDSTVTDLLAVLLGVQDF